MKKLFAIIILSVLCLNIVMADTGAIWTTRDDCGEESQNVNRYARGERVYINGENFDAEEYAWAITGQPSGASCDPTIVVAFGDYLADSSGDFCFEAYTIDLDDCGEYQVNFGEKIDNYRVDINAPVVPEFGLIIGVLTMLGAVGAFFVIRRR